ncbi:MAG TPA: hypothetical protein VMW75_16645 [Thermoanaerobaculia bacterium]|nr:hypothetical protein [Thermoanaerobaculia bacterium]
MLQPLLAACVLAAGLAGPAAAAASDRPPSRLRLARLASPLVPGQQAQLVVETVGEHGEPLPALHPLKVTLVGATGLTAITQVTVETGSSKVEVPIRATKPGLWQIDARAEGLYSASVVMVCVAPEVLQRHQAVAGVQARQAAAPSALHPAPPGSGGPRAAAPPVKGAAPAVTGAAATVARSNGGGSLVGSGSCCGPSSRPAAPPNALVAQSKPPAPAGAPPARTEEERLRALGTAPAAPPRPLPRTLAARPLAVRSGTERAAAAAAAAEPGGAAAAGARGAAGAASPGAAGAGATGAASAGATAETGAAGAAGETGAAGEVRLIPEHLERYRGPQGWESVSVDAYWYEQGKPSVAPRLLDLALVANQGDLQIAPAHLNILPGDYVTRQPAKVTAVAAAKASLQALYPGGQSNLVDVSFLAAPAAKLSFSSGPQVIRAFGVVSSEVYLRLLDASGVPALADQPIQVTLQLSGPTGSPQLPPALIKAGEFETSAQLSLPRFGAYTVIASAPNLADANALQIQVAFDWFLLLATLAGGLLGSLTRVLYRGDSAEQTPRRLLRVLLLGGLAALLVVLMSAFGLLSLLAGALPQGWSDALSKVPLASLTGVFLLGFLAGLLFDRIFGGLVSPAAKPAAAAAPPAAKP